MRRATPILLAFFLLIGMTGVSQAHVQGGKFSAMALQETVNNDGGYAVTAKVWNYTSTSKRVRVVVEVVVSQTVQTTETFCLVGTCDTYPSWENLDRFSTVSTTLRVPAFGTNRKRLYGNFTATGWSFGADNYVYSDVVHAHKL